MEEVEKRFFATDALVGLAVICVGVVDLVTFVGAVLEAAANDAGLTGFATVGMILRLFSQTLVPLLTATDGGAAVGAVTLVLEVDFTGW